jgi:hypothetical protein
MEKYFILGEEVTKEEYEWNEKKLKMMDKPVRHKDDAKASCD